MKKQIFTFLMMVVCAVGNAQISITSGSFTYDESFTSSASVPTGWDFFETGTNANSSYSVGTGTFSTGDTYFLGTAGDFAFGGLQSGSLVPNVGVCFTNNTGANLTSISISFVGETWRVGAANRSDRIDCQLNINTTAINGSGTWTAVDELDYANPGQALGNGSLQHSSTITHTISSLNIPNGTTFCLRWLSFDATSSDDALGIGSFSITAITLPIELASLKANITGKSTLLSFSTATEVRNDYFSIERSADGNNFTAIGRVEGAGTTYAVQNYTYEDQTPLKGTNYYRLKQVDTDGAFAYSPVVSVVFGQTGTIRLSPMPATDNMRLLLDQPATELAVWEVTDQSGRLLLTGQVAAESTEANIPVASLTSGVYIVRFINGQSVEVKQFVKE